MICLQEVDQELECVYNDFLVTTSQHRSSSVHQSCSALQPKTSQTEDNRLTKSCADMTNISNTNGTLSIQLLAHLQSSALSLVALPASGEGIAKRQCSHCMEPKLEAKDNVSNTKQGSAKRWDCRVWITPKVRYVKLTNS